MLISEGFAESQDAPDLTADYQIKITFQTVYVL
jgi:hypothetical protein